MQIWLTGFSLTLRWQLAKKNQTVFTNAQPSSTGIAVSGGSQCLLIKPACWDSRPPTPEPTSVAPLWIVKKSSTRCCYNWREATFSSLTSTAPLLLSQRHTFCNQHVLGGVAIMCLTSFFFPLFLYKSCCYMSVYIRRSRIYNITQSRDAELIIMIQVVYCNPESNAWNWAVKKDKHLVYWAYFLAFLIWMTWS